MRETVATNTEVVSNLSSARDKSRKKIAGPIGVLWGEIPPNIFLPKKSIFRGATELNRGQKKIGREWWKGK